LQDKQVERAMVVDCDVHQGNGTAHIFAGDPAVFTLSIHQFDNFPADKPPSTVDIHLPDSTGDREYLAQLGPAIEKGLREFRPQLVIYVAGADPYEQDKLGGLALTLTGLKERDKLVYNLCLANNAAVAVTLAGGYAINMEDTITVHCNTAQAALETIRTHRRTSAR
jgi:acetoin utilization deacetylase AcuC-like enzyme